MRWPSRDLDARFAAWAQHRLARPARTLLRFGLVPSGALLIAWVTLANWLALFSLAPAALAAYHAALLSVGAVLGYGAARRDMAAARKMKA